MSDAHDALALQPGTRFGRYRVERKIGEGGMGAVYEATHVELKKRVALKVLLPAVAENPEALARFIREGEATSRIRHPHVVDVTDLGTHEGVPFLVMEFLEGEDLAKLLDREQRLPVMRAVDLLLPVLAGVATAHEGGVVHRDLKPENILLSRVAHGGLHPVVLDFGISKLVTNTGDLGLTGTSAILGTPFYMSPEQARGGKNLDARSDQYALGTVLYRCTTGTLPCKGDSLYAVLHQIVEGSFARPRVVAPELSDAFESIVMKAMSLDPANRYPSLLAMGAALLPFASAKTHVVWSEAFGVDTGGEGAGRAPVPTTRFAAGEATRYPADPCAGPARTTLGESVRVLNASEEPPLVTPRKWGLLLGAASAIAAIAMGAMFVRLHGNTRPHASSRVVPTSSVRLLPPPLVVSPPAPQPSLAPVAVPRDAVVAPPRVALTTPPDRLAHTARSAESTAARTRAPRPAPVAAAPAASPAPWWGTPSARSAPAVAPTVTSTPRIVPANGSLILH